jgi:ferredoxin
MNKHYNISGRKLRRRGWMGTKAKNYPRLTPQFHEQCVFFSNRYHEIDALKKQAQLIEAKLKEINIRIKELESGKRNLKLIASVDDKKCTGCTQCLSVCPNGAISICHNIAEIERTKCDGCALCATACRMGAITLKELT